MFGPLKRSLNIVLLLMLLAFPLQAVGASSTGSMQNYVVLYRSNAVSADAASVIKQAGGELVYTYDKIGVAIARSDQTDFRDKLLLDQDIENASSTTGFGVKLQEEFEVVDTTAQVTPVTYNDPLFPLQWDMLQIHVPEAQAIATGKGVVVGDIDTGLDYTHPDLAANVDFADSASCLSGAPDNNPAAWMDQNGHGTHTAGTIAAVANNGIGVIGIAPDAKIAAIRAGNADGYFFPEAVICSFMWAADHHIDVTNNSYYADPYLFNCRNDATQRAIWKAEQRAISYAMQQGVAVIAANGNENIDLSKQNIDATSPDYPPGSEVTREVTNACVEVPNEIPGVIGVNADGYNKQKSYYSSYGVGVTQLIAPGGDTRYQRPPSPMSGAVLSTYPGNRYANAQGTSMASPHVVGVAALAISEFGKLSPGQLQALLNQTADPMPCPPNPFDPGGVGRYLATCVGGTGYNGFYGHGLVNALSAVTHKP